MKLSILICLIITFNTRAATDPYAISAVSATYSISDMYMSYFDYTIPVDNSIVISDPSYWEEAYEGDENLADMLDDSLECLTASCEQALTTDSIDVASSVVESESAAEAKDLDSGSYETGPKTIDIGELEQKIKNANKIVQ